MKVKALLLAAAAVVTMGGAASAATFYATMVESYTPGTGYIAPDRSVTANATGGPDGKFLSLGLGGEAVFSFGSSFGSPLTITEITFNRPMPNESALIYVGDGMTWTLLGSSNNVQADTTFTFSGIFTKVKVVDTSAKARNADGYDIDAIGVSPVPVPAAGLLLAGGLGLLGARKMRRKA